MSVLFDEARWTPFVPKPCAPSTFASEADIEFNSTAHGSLSVLFATLFKARSRVSCLLAEADKLALVQQNRVPAKALTQVAANLVVVK
ncbi:MAG: hypothetical protein MJA27_34485 [Pseudanabaenales cyanobacterium]|nr:hypothetical protein [Pseudanabaenales cyanobacterium]